MILLFLDGWMEVKHNVSQSTFHMLLSHLTRSLSSALCDAQEYKRKQIEEQRQAERLQRQLQQERAYLVSLQQQQQEPPRPPQDKKQLYHYKDQAPGSNDKPVWAQEVASDTETQANKCTKCSKTISTQPYVSGHFWNKEFYFLTLF